VGVNQFLGLPMDELHYVDEMKPFTREDWDKCIEAYSHRWLSELHGRWLAETEQERKLRELAETYHTGCEAYDRRVCSGTLPRTGEAMPMTVDEMRLINNHALRMREGMVEEGERFGFTRRQVEKAIRDYVRGIG
jgi:hypothetical protein